MPKTSQFFWVMPCIILRHYNQLLEIGCLKHLQSRKLLNPVTQNACSSFVKKSLAVSSLGKIVISPLKPLNVSCNFPCYIFLLSCPLLSCFLSLPSPSNQSWFLVTTWTSPQRDRSKVTQLGIKMGLVSGFLAWYPNRYSRPVLFLFYYASLPFSSLDCFLVWEKTFSAGHCMQTDVVSSTGRDEIKFSQVQKCCVSWKVKS